MFKARSSGAAGTVSADQLLNENTRNNNNHHNNNTTLKLFQIPFQSLANFLVVASVSFIKIYLIVCAYTDGLITIAMLDLALVLMSCKDLLMQNLVF